MRLNRVYIIGITGTGKTSLAKKLSSILKIKAYDLDDIFWKRKYDLKRDEKQRSKILNKIVKNKSWIIEGVYTLWVNNAIKKSDLVIWLNFPFYILAYNILKRFILRTGKHKESIIDLFLLLKYAYRYKKKDQKAGFYEYKELIENNKVDYIYLKNKKEISKFLNELNLNLN